MGQGRRVCVQGCGVVLVSISDAFVSPNSLFDSPDVCVCVCVCVCKGVCLTVCVFSPWSCSYYTPYLSLSLFLPPPSTITSPTLSPSSTLISLSLSLLHSLHPNLRSSSLLIYPSTRLSPSVAAAPSPLHHACLNEIKQYLRTRARTHTHTHT